MKKSVLEAKKEAVKKIADLMKNSVSAVVVDYRGLKVSQMTDLRKDMYKNKVTFHVIKNNVLVRAAKEAGYDGFEKLAKGPTAVAFSDKDAIAPAKILKKYADASKVVKFKGGMIEKKMVSVKDIETYAALPSRKELLATLANILQDPIRHVALLVKAISEKKAKADKASA